MLARAQEFGLGHSRRDTNYDSAGQWCSSQLNHTSFPLLAQVEGGQY